MEELITYCKDNTIQIVNHKYGLTAKFKNGIYLRRSDSNPKELLIDVKHYNEQINTKSIKKAQ